MLLAAAAIPSAPVLAPGVCPVVPEPLHDLAETTRATIEALPEADLAVLVADGESGIYDRAEMHLAGLGLPGLRRTWATEQTVIATLARVTQLPRQRAIPLPLGLACLGLHVDGRWPLVPLSVPPRSNWDVLVATGAGIVEALDQLAVRAVLIGAADGSAGLSPKAPRAVVDGAARWQEALVDAFATGDTERLAGLGPQEAARVFSRGWAPLAVLHGALKRARLDVVLRATAAPRGVGYLVAHSRSP